MNREKKEEFVAEMKARLERAHATFLVDYQGLNVDAMNSLRQELRKVDAEIQVMKNRLLKLASQDTDTASIQEHFVGPCAVAITYEDAVGPAKVLIEQSKDSKHLKVKAGQIEGKFVDFAGIKRLAELPSREILLAQVLAGMQAVPASFVRVLSGVTLKLLYALKAIENQKNEAGN